MASHDQHSSPGSFDTTSKSCAEINEWAQTITRLIQVAPSLCDSSHNLLQRLCDEVEVSTHQRARLVIEKPAWQKSSTPPLQSVLFTLPVCFGQYHYGSLGIAAQHNMPTTPAIPFMISMLLASVCGWLIYTLEFTSFLRLQKKKLPDKINRDLTRREKEVLLLMFRGYDQKAIAQKLSIGAATVHKHRQHIYEALNVHNEYDALLVAYHNQLVSPFEYEFWGPIPMEHVSSLSRENGHASKALWREEKIRRAGRDR